MEIMAIRILKTMSSLMELIGKDKKISLSNNWQHIFRKIKAQYKKNVLIF